MSDHLTAIFNDGKTALAFPVRLVVEADALRLVDAAGAQQALWPYEGLYLAEEQYRGQPVRLMHRSSGPACLTLRDDSALQSLRALSPALSKALGSSRHRWSWRGIAWTGIAAAVLVALIAWGLPRAADSLISLVPWSWGRALGDQVVASLETSAPACEATRDAPGQRALEQLVGLLMHSPAAKGRAPDQFRVVMLDTPIPNALAAPGGRILVFRGIIGLARSQDELAGVLAHEVGHSLSRHPERGLLRALGWHWLLAGLFGSDAWGVGSVQTLLTLAYTREDERTADRLGVALLEADGLRSGGLASFLEHLAANPKWNGRGTPAFLASHPLPEARAKDLRALVNPRMTGAPWTAQEWRAIRSMCSGAAVKPTAAPHS